MSLSLSLITNRADNGLGQERLHMILGLSFKAWEGADRQPTPFSPLRFMAADYFLFIAGCPPGTNIEVSDSMWDFLCSWQMFLQMLKRPQIYLSGWVTMPGKCHVKPLSTIASHDNWTLGTVWPRHQRVLYRLSASNLIGSLRREIIQFGQAQAQLGSVCCAQSSNFCWPYTVLSSSIGLGRGVFWPGINVTAPRTSIVDNAYLQPCWH